MTAIKVECLSSHPASCCFF